MAKTTKDEPLQWTRCRGRNGWDAPQDIPADMGEECLNVHFYDGGLGTKRGRWCAACCRIWNAWSHKCPKCGAQTEAEDAA